MNLEQQLQKAIYSKATDHAIMALEKEKKDPSNPKLVAHEAFKAGAAFLLPVLMKAIEQRDEAVSDLEDIQKEGQSLGSGSRILAAAKNQELLKMLGEL